MARCMLLILAIAEAPCFSASAQEDHLVPEESMLNAAGHAWGYYKRIRDVLLKDAATVPSGSDGMHADGRLGVGGDGRPRG